ncbi:Glycosyltransferase, GT2 family [Actinopolyspora alba]|uniref:Glycosyltransferase, GT2 family n=1 Tax=Actinopolyspora alba TaxID=673379 RepID=A0A1I1XT82_9ACTN|nr:glycosyltransferase [Actinopolyspora alba]SFE08810.1 Glycosyltransferase, GT2 family [Actinopolyspora alba]
MRTANIVVAVRGNHRELAGLLRHIAAQDFTGRIEVILVDNHRRRRISPSVLVEAGLAGTVVHEPRPGLSRARNTGVEHVTGEFVLFTDPDSRPHPGWASALIRALTETGAYCAGGRVVPRFVGFSEPPALEPGLAQFFVPPDWPSEPCELRPPFWLVGCNLATRSMPRPVFDERLGVRPWRHLSCEDLELTVRTEHAGLGVVVAPDAIARRAIHAADVRLPRLLARGFWHGVSVARLRRRHPRAVIYDSVRLSDVLGAVPREHWRTVATHLARITGWRLETLRPTRRVSAGKDEGVKSR